MKAVILARVSTKRQEKEGLSLQDIQLPMLREYAKEHGIEVVKEFVFQESADQKIRKRFVEMIEYVRKHKDIKAIIGYRVDRITRNYRDAVKMDSLRIDDDKELHFVHDRLVITKKSVGRDITDWDTKVYLAKQFLNRLKEDAHNTIQRKLENGELPGPAPFGYKNVTQENKKKWVVPDEFTSLVVKNIFGWYVSENYSIGEIAKKLKSEYNIKKSKSAVHFILNNKFYIGTNEHSNKQYPHRYELFISEDAFDKASKLMNKRNARKQPFKYAGKEFAYRGLITCKECDCRITPEQKKRKLKNGDYNLHVYYHCTNYHKTHDKVKNITEESLDKQFASIFENLRIPQDKLEELVTSLKETHKDKVYFFEQELGHLNTELKRLRKRIELAYEDRLDQRITIEDYEDIRKKNEEKEINVKTKIAQLEKANKEYYITTSHLVEIGSRSADIFSRSKPHEKRALINLVLQNVTLDGEKVRYKARFPFSIVLKYAPSSNWLPVVDLLRNLCGDPLLSYSLEEIEHFKSQFPDIFEDDNPIFGVV